LQLTGKISLEFDLGYKVCFYNTAFTVISKCRKGLAIKWTCKRALNDSAVYFSAYALLYKLIQNC